MTTLPLFVVEPRRRATLRWVQQFPSLKAKDVLALLRRSPLGYVVVRQRGSHRQLRADGYGPVLFSYHDGRTVPPRVLRKILVEEVGLNEDQALGLARGEWP
jgi:predicted RNA binding protein YcfA (HicA-like mRNA interferase family)